MQTIEGGDLLKSLADLIFKGLNKILDYDPEYEEEMGVLKQVTRIPIIDVETDDQVGVLTIKLSPVKDKEGLYYVEAESTAPGFDVSSINKKTVRLNKNNEKSFKKLIDDLFEGNDAEMGEDDTKADEAEEATDEQTSESTANDSESVSEKVDQFNNLNPIIAEDRDGQPLVVNRQVTIEDDGVSCTLTINVTDVTGNDVKQYKEVTIPLKKVNETSFDEFKKLIDSNTKDYMDKYKLTKSSRNIRSSISVSATLVKASKTNEVSLVAINASTDICAAYDLIADAIEDEDFLNELPEDEEVSYSISDSGDALEIEPIDEVDTSGTYTEIFNLVASEYSSIISFKWAVGATEWSSDPVLSTVEWSIQDLAGYVASLVCYHDNTYPCMPSVPCPFDDMMEVTKDTIKEHIVIDLKRLIDELDVYYVNLSVDEQAKIGQLVSSIKQSIAYA